MKYKIENIKNNATCYMLRATRRGGYTIIETMIATSLFIVIIMAGMGTLLNASLLNQKSQNMRSIMDNLSFVMEDIGRNLRTGYDYHCFVAGDTISYGILSPKSCPTGGGISFKSALGGQWVYYVGINSNGITYSIFKAIDGAIVQLTPDEVAIDAVASSFSVLGAEAPPDTQQPFVIIKLVGKITYKNVITPFSLQTSVSQRIIDI